jgi:hypothetical protein
MASKNLGRATGKSAYEVWLAQGNKGTEQDFLNSLKADVEVPTKLSELDNDKGFITENDIPTIPTKTSQLTNDSNFINAETDPKYTADKPNIALKSEIPTKVSDLTNDKNYLTSYTETDPTVPAWAKATTKPSYTKSEVGLGNVENVKQYSASNPPPYPVTSVNGNIGAVTVSVPTATSDLANDSGFITNAEIDKLTLGINPADGLVYLYKDGKIIGSGIEMGATGESIGYVDVATNTIIINTSLGEGTYVVQYEMEEGDPVYIGKLDIDNTVRYKVTNNLTKCSTNNDADEVIGGESYTAIISPDTGHIVDSITVKMGINDITDRAVEGNTISIDSVDGAIEITAIAIEQTVTDTYTITNNLTNCTNSNKTAQLESGKPYTATISTTNKANDAGDTISAYALSSIKVLMKGVDVSSDVVAKTATGANINIASVTGPVIITASAVENLIAKSVDTDGKTIFNGVGYQSGKSQSSSSGNIDNQSGYTVTGFMPVEANQTIRIKNIDNTNTNSRNNMVFYSYANGVYTRVTASTLHGMFGDKATDEGNGVYSRKLVASISTDIANNISKIQYMRFSSSKLDSTSVIVVDKTII